MFCTECGTRNSADSKYCKECGHKINDGYRTMMLSIEDTRAIEDEQSQDRLTKLLDMAFWHNQAGNADAAVLACDAALTIHPQCTTAHSLLGSLYEKKGDDARAIEHFEAVVRLNPESAADAAKLDQVRRGVHVKAVQPPSGYKWLPPALVGLDWSRWKPRPGGLSLPSVASPVWPERLPKPSPLVAAGAVTGLVLAAGLMTIRPARPVDAAIRQAAVVPMSPRIGIPAGGSTSVDAINAPNGLPAPVVLKAGPQTSAQSFVAVEPDPFGEIMKLDARTSPGVRAGRPSHTTRLAAISRGSDSALTLPPLTLRALPIERSGDLAPAPVSIPEGVSLSSMPQHTVVVPSLGRTAAYQPLQAAAVTTDPPRAQYGAASEDLSSHIHISINDSPSNGSVTISDRPDSRTPRRTETTGSDDGDAYQQTALTLQQQGDFGRARAAYQKAIRAYKTQISSGHNADAANQGLAASQTGLQICEQSRQ